MKKITIKAAQVLLGLVYLWVAVTLVLLLLTFILQLFGANPDAGFVEWVYRSTERAMAPFRGIFEPVELTDESVLDTSVLFAMVVYGFVAIGLHAAVDAVTRLLRAEERLEQRRAVMEASAAAVAGPGRVVQLSAASGLAVTASLVPGTYGTTVELAATGLDPLQSYTAWLEGADGVRTSTATFQATQAGTARIALATSMLLVDARRFGLTQLPRYGETTSTDVLATPLA